MPIYMCKPVVHEEHLPLVHVRHLSVRYDGHLALEDLSFQLAPGQHAAVVGPNGAGKSTLFKVLAGVLPPSEGEITIHGHSPERHICVAYVPQRSQVDWSFPVTVEDVVMMGRAGQLGVLRRPGRRDREVVREALAAVDLLDLVDRPIGALSGGQQQRMFLARALAQEASLLLMDEPLAGLDFPAQEALLDLIERMRDRGITVMVATHNLSVAAEHFDFVLLLNRRLIAAGTPEEVLSPEHLQEAYGEYLQLLQVGGGVLALGDTCCGGGSK